MCGMPVYWTKDLATEISMNMNEPCEHGTDHRKPGSEENLQCGACSLAF